MKIFLSWSGTESHQVAKALKSWLPKVLKNIEPFLSSEDIHQGANWQGEIVKSIRESKFSIICVTKYNLNSQWLNFEAGALIKYENSPAVCPFLYKMTKNDLGGPLSHFQSTSTDEKLIGITKLVLSIKNACELREPSNDQVEKLVRNKYSELEKEFNDIETHNKEDLSLRNEKLLEKNSLFISTPMSAYSSEIDLKESKTRISKIIHLLNKKYKFSKITCPAENIEKSDAFNDIEIAIIQDLKDVQLCEYFLCIYPEKQVSSVLVEIGYAISRGKKCVLIVKNREDLPYLLQQADKRINNFKIYEYKDFDNLDKFFEKREESLFTFDRI